MKWPGLVGMLSVLILAGSLACNSQSDIKKLQSENARLSSEVEQLRQQLERLQTNVGDLAAQSILGKWSREMPQATRVSDNYSALRESVSDPAPGAAAQLNRALVRTANVAALDFVLVAMAGQPESRQLEILNQCMEFMLGITSATRSCQLAPIAP